MSTIIKNKIIGYIYTNDTFFLGSLKMEELCNNSGHSATSSSGSNSSISAKTALSECSAAWINYLSALNNLCTAGSKLAHSIAVLEQWSLSEKPLFNNYTTSYLTNSWNDLAR